MGAGRSEIVKRWNRAKAFAVRNARDISQLDSAKIRGKLRSLTKVHLRRIIRLAVSLPIGVVVVLAIRLARPIALVRIGSINTTRLGHMLIDVEMATAERRLGANSPARRTVDLWFPWGPRPTIANRHLLQMWRRAVIVFPAWFLEGAAHINAFLPGGHRHSIPYRKGPGTPHNFQDIHGALRTLPPTLTFLEGEVRQATARLEILGIEPGSPIVCVHSRSAGFLNRQLGAVNAAGQDFRDADITSFIPAMTQLAGRGYTVVRMGMRDEEPLTTRHPRIIDYATSHLQSELLDLFIPSNCTFFMSALSGPAHVAQLFRRPMLIVNLVPMSTMQLASPGFLFVPKVLRDSTGRRLPLREIISSGAFEAKHSTDYSRLNLTVEQNSPEDILDACEEMRGRLDGTWSGTPDDEARHDEFLGILPEFAKAGRTSGRISAGFLRANPWFLD